jgi:hypothetical protein
MLKTKTRKQLSCAAFALLLLQTATVAKAEISLAIKNSETLEVMPLYYHSGCKSLLTKPPSAEILDGPPQLTISVKEKQVLARAQQCAKPISGGILQITAKDVTDVVTSTVVVRIKYQTKDGDRFRSETLRVTMVP